MADETALHPVPVGACRCPGTPHPDGDVVYLDPVLSTPAGMAAQTSLLQTEGGWADRHAAMIMALMRHSVREWTFLDEKRKPLPVSPAAVERQLTWLNGGKEVAGAAASLYADIVLGPFIEAFSSSRGSRSKKTRSRPGPSAGSTDTPST